MTDQFHWWQSGIIYQIYPRSFQDSNGDGLGDLPGIIQRLDYIKSLNVDAIWLSPIYPSPMHDFGYDVSDYTDIHPMFGSMADLDRLLAEVHQRDMKLILDLVPNHTSDEHPWFIESRSSRNSPRRDWYIWRDPAPDGGPPNNWLSIFGGPAWTLDPQTGQYYLHQFDPHQPELNYRHPDVLPALLQIMRFWLDKGIDGFRVDVIWMMLKDDRFRNEPPNPDFDKLPARLQHDHMRLQHRYTGNLAGVHQIIRQMRAVLDEYDERMMVGELYLPLEELVNYYGQKLDECHLPYNFALIWLPWQLQAISQAVSAYEAALPPGAWPNWVLGNHDQHRVASRVGADQLRVATMLLFTLRGTPTHYYGDEIGMENVPIPLHKVQDPPAVNQPDQAHLVGRDPVRTPMQWDNSPNAGFAAENIEPWLPVASDYTERNVAQQERDPLSMLNFFRALTSLRRTEPALSAGSYALVDSKAEDVYTYLRTFTGSDSFLVVLNFGTQSHTLDLSQVAVRAEIAVATMVIRTGQIDLSRLQLGANEGLVLRLE